MKQKLGLCCSLISSPPLILLDEPTVGVDPLSRRELWNILGQFSHEEGVGVLVSTSYMDESAYCNRTLIMYQGRLLVDAPPADVIARAEGMCVTVQTPEKINTRQFQSRLSAMPGIINATPQGGTVRIILPPDHPTRQKLEEYHPQPGSPDFSDGFMTLLAEQTDPAPEDVPVPEGKPLPEQAAEGTSSSGSRTSYADSAISPPSTTSASPSGKGRSSACWGRTGGGEAPPSACSAGCCLPPAARST